MNALAIAIVVAAGASLLALMGLAESVRRKARRRQRRGRPSTRGVVTLSGGGEIHVTVARRTERYPLPGARVVVIELGDTNPKRET